MKIEDFKNHAKIHGLDRALVDMPEFAKEFFVKDMSGRGFSRSVKAWELLEWEDEKSDNGKMMHEWVKNAEEGDVWSSASTGIVCTNS